MTAPSLRRSALLSAPAAALVVAGIVAVIALRPHSGYPYLDAMTIRGVAMVPSGEGWAVGTISGRPNGLMLHLTHGHWTVVPDPTGLDPRADLYAVAMLSPEEGWAVGAVQAPLAAPNTTRPEGAILRYRAGGWTLTPVPASGALRAVAVRSASDVWATGDQGTVLHFDGSQWTTIAAPPNYSSTTFSAISAPPGGGVWIAGNSVILRYDGTAWTQEEIAAPALPGLNITSLALQSGGEGWATGGVNGSTHGFILHDVSGRWLLDTESDEMLASVTASDGDGWAVGASGTIYRYTQGSWTPIASSSHAPLLGISAVSAREAWAVGADGLLLHYANGAWRIERNVTWDQTALNSYS